MSFNPCYVGLWSVSPSHFDEYLAEWLFQSLLCWIMVCKRESGRDMFALVQFQSLLCWIMVCKNRHNSGRDRLCFVSILVMLDYGL